MIKKLILLRHGESHGNVDRKAYESYPDYAIRLTHKGAEQARAAGNKLKELEGNFDVFLSPYFRTRQTLAFAKENLGEGRILSEIESSCLREQEWNGLRLSAYDSDAENFRNKVGSFYYRFDHAESGADVFNRMLIFHELKMLPLLKSGEAENVLVVSHGYSLRVYLKILLGMNVEEFEMMRNFRNAEMIELEYNDGNFELKSKLNIRPKRISHFSYDKNDLA